MSRIACVTVAAILLLSGCASTSDANVAVLRKIGALEGFSVAGEPKALRDAGGMFGGSSYLAKSDDLQKRIESLCEHLDASQLGTLSVAKEDAVRKCTTVLGDIGGTYFVTSGKCRIGITLAFVAPQDKKGLALEARCKKA